MLDRREPFCGEVERVAGVVAAHGATGTRGEADEPGLAALDAARQVRQVAREPEQLQLEGEDERVERRALRARRRVVEQVEEPRERGEGALVRLRLAEEAQHRLGADQADVQAVAVLAGGVVRAQELDPGDRLELAGSLVEHQLDVRERLEPGAEPRVRLPHAFRDCADAATTGGVEVQDPVGLGEADRPEHDRLRLVSPSGHVV